MPLTSDRPFKNMRSLFTALVPAALLLLTISIAGVLAYLITPVIGDTLTLPKVLSKTTLILLVLSIFPIMTWLQLTKQDIGLTDDKNIFCRQIAKGLVFGICILAPIIICLWWLDLWHYDFDKNWTTTKIMAKVFSLIVIALLVSIPEEFIFRGILLTGLSNKLGTFLGISISALYYAGLHFLKSKTEIPLQELSLMSSYWVTVDALNNLFRVSNLPAFIALFTVGTFLACVRTRLPLSIGLCIGIHAGWVFLIKMTSTFFDKSHNPDLQFLVSDYDGVIGSLVSFWLVLLTALFLFFKRDFRR